MGETCTVQVHHAHLQVYVLYMSEMQPLDGIHSKPLLTPACASLVIFLKSSSTVHTHTYFTKKDTVFAIRYGKVSMSVNSAAAFQENNKRSACRCQQWFTMYTIQWLHFAHV